MYDNLTKDDIKKMQEEIEYRKLVVRKEALEAVKEARAQGDLSENFEYKAAKQDKNRNESRIRYLEKMIKTARIVSDESKSDEVGLGDRVELYIPEDDETESYKLVTTVRGNSMKGLISIDSPLGKAIKGRKTGDKVYIKVNDTYGYEAEIRSIIDFVKKLGEKYGKMIPVVVAGGIYTHEDVLRQLELGADGVQVATRFVTTEECDAPEAYKQAYIQAKQEDIVITKSPVGMPGRAIRNAFLKQVEAERKPPKHCYQCLERCDRAKIPYCITDALVQAAEGHLDQALLFCGSNAYRAERIETVQEVMDDLVFGI